MPDILELLYSALLGFLVTTALLNITFIVMGYGPFRWQERAWARFRRGFTSLLDRGAEDDGMSFGPCWPFRGRYEIVSATLDEAADWRKLIWSPVTLFQGKRGYYSLVAARNRAGHLADKLYTYSAYGVRDRATGSVVSAALGLTLAPDDEARTAYFLAWRILGERPKFWDSPPPGTTVDAPAPVLVMRYAPDTDEETPVAPAAPAHDPERSVLHLQVDYAPWLTPSP